MLATPMSPLKSTKNGKTVFRRRLDPEYDVFSRPVPGTVEGVTYAMHDGVFNVYRRPPLGQGQDTDPSALPASNAAGSVDNDTVGKSLYDYASFNDFVADFGYLRRIINMGPVKSFAFKRLKLLEAKFKLHTLLNDTRELEATKSVPHRDFYNVRKVRVQIAFFHGK